MKRTRLRHRSVKRQAQMLAYRLAKGELMARADGRCEARLEGCTDGATDLHHLQYRSRGASFVPGEGEAKALCRHCHNRVHSHTREARERGLLK